MAERTLFTTHLRRAMPPWLRRTYGGRVLDAIATAIDDMVDRTAESVKLRFPGYESTALPYIGRDRRIRRGPGESDESYAARLLRWWDDHQVRGGPYALLEQLRAYYATSPRQIDLVYASGQRYILHEDGTITRDAITWGATGNPAEWAHVWLFFYEPTEPTADQTYIDQLLAVPRDWSSGHVILHVVVLWPGVELWDYPQPVGTWDEPGGVWTDDEPLQFTIL